jgi:hypothetical protein
MVTHDWNLPTLIDHTVLRPDATKSEVLRLCQEAREFGFVVIFVPPCYIDEAVEAVVGTRIRVAFQSDSRWEAIRRLQRSRRPSKESHAGPGFSIW